MALTADERARVLATGVKGGHGHFPLPVPNGWFGVSPSSAVAPGEVRNVHYFGRDLVVFRGEDGTPGVLDAYCPHLGAHLGVGAGAPESIEPGPGKVRGNCIECPFHGWQFDVDGRCVEIPYSRARIPAKATVRSYPANDLNGMIFAWHHLLGEAPAWELPEIPEFDDPDWVGPVYTDRHIGASVQDITENDQDTVHFRYVHGSDDIPDQTTTFEGRIRHTAGRTRMGGEMNRTTYQLGMGILRIPNVLTFMYATSPVDEENSHQQWLFAYHRSIGDDAGREMIDAFSKSGIYQDIPIWNAKRFTAKPLLVEGDGPILAFRRWASQFYSTPTTG
jgi:phenylpropionate dioxygenase-like ring-hydroxylating dioxygenase large terminal subunit